MARILIPPAQPYSDGLVAYGAACSPPPGEPRWGSFQFDWANVSQATPGYVIDMSQYPNLPKQIATLYVDNSRSRQGILIIFPDTGFKIIVSPFVRGYYQVLTKSTQFYIGITDPIDNADDCHTFVAACDFFVPPQVEEVKLRRDADFTLFDPSASVALTRFQALPGQFSRLRSGYLQLSNMQATAAGFSAVFEMFGDARPILLLNLVIGANGFVDTNNLWQGPGMEIDCAAASWDYSWTVTGGALTAPGGAILGTYFDIAAGI